MFFRVFYSGVNEGLKSEKANQELIRLAFGAKFYFNLVRSLLGGAGLFFNVILIVRF
ncbi:MAG: hypothetical protein ACJAX4_003759 [Clostridium sp.]|jgi:hypothetical protein